MKSKNNEGLIILTSCIEQARSAGVAIKKNIVFAGVFVALMLLWTQSGVAQTTYNWTQAAAGAQSWTNSANWSGGMVPDPVAGDTIATAYTPTAGVATLLDLEADRTFQTFSTSFGGFANTEFTINSGNTITLDGSNPTIHANDKSKLTINCILAGTNGLRKTGTALLTLGNAANTFSGGITLAGGTLAASSDGRFGDAGNDIAVSANSTLTLSSGTYSRNIAISEGAQLQYSEKNTVTISGEVTGAGGIRISSSGFGHQDVTFSSTGNTFTGALRLGQGDTGVTAKFNSFADSVNPIELLIGTKDHTTFVWGPGAVAPLVLESRQIVLSGGGNKNHVIENANSNHTITVNTDFIVTRTSAQPLVLQGVNTGENTISGVISNGASSVTSLQKAGSGTWVLSGKNTYTGSTTVSGGILKLTASECLADAGTLTINGGKLELEAGVRERIDNLVLGSTTQTELTSYGSSLSSAAIKDDARFAGTGLLLLGVDPPPAGTLFIIK